MLDSRRFHHLKTHAIVALLILLAITVVGTSTRARAASAADTGSISGTVTNSTGAPASGVYVNVSGTAGSSSTVQTAADGTYTAPGLAAGTYTVTFTAFDGVSARQYWNDQPITGTPTPVVVGDGQAVTNIDAALKKNGSISGTVTVGSGSPAANVTVNANGASTGTQSAVTAADGTYTIPNLPADTYNVEFSPSDGVSAHQYWNAQPFNGTPTPVVVSAGHDATGIDAALVVGGSISGTVTHSSGAPFANLLVSVPAVDGGGGAVSFTAMTAADGTYKVTGLSPATYTVNFSPNDGVDEAQIWNNQPATGIGTPVPVAAGQNVTGIDAVIAAWPVNGSISGTVTDPSGTAVANVPVFAWNGASVEAVAYTAADGTYTITGLAANNYTVEFYEYGGTFAAQYWHAQQLGGTPTTVTVGAGVAVTGIDAALEVGGSISGTVTDSSGAPIANVTVNAIGASVGQGGVVTAADGTYAITGLPRDTYTVNFTPADATVVGESWNNQPLTGTPTPIPVVLGQAVTGIDAVLQKNGSISGTVTDSHGAPAGNVVVNVTGAGGKRGGAATQADGTYTITGITADTYTVEFDPSDGISAPQYWNAQPKTGTPTPLVVQTGEVVTKIDAALEVGGSISGSVTDNLGNPVAGVDVQAQGSVNVHGNAFTAADGTYTIGGLAADTYTVQFSPADATVVGQFWNDQLFNGTPTPVAVVAGHGVTGIDAVLARASSISGTVTDSSGAPVAGASVTVSGATIGSATAHTAADGSYTIGGLPAGTYTVEYFPSDGTLTAQYWNGQPLDGTPTPINLTVGQSETGINAVLSGGASISGTVTDRHGVPVANAFVDAERAGGGSALAYTGSDGTYTMTGVPAGTYTVQFTPADASLLGQYWNDQPLTGTPTPVVVGVGANVTGINAGLDAPASVSGTVTGSSGAPVANALVWVAGARGTSGFAQTAADGTYTVTGLPADSYTVEFDPGVDNQATMQMQYWQDSPDLAAATPVVVASGEAATGIDAALLGHNGTLVGAVTDGTTGAALNNTCVTLWSGSSQLRTECPYGGNYAMHDVAPGTYTLSIVDADGTHVTQWAGGAATQGASTPVVISGDGSTVTVNAAMTGVPGTISGTVFISGQNPAQTECVYLYHPGATGTYAGQATCTNSLGHYLLSGMAPGNYVVAFVDPMGLTPTLWSGGVTTQAAATTVTVSADGAATGVDVTPVPADGTIVGRVFNPDYSGGLANICVYAFAYNATTGDLASNATAATCTNAVGGYSLSGLPITGDFQLAYVDPTGTYPTDWTFSSVLSGDNYGDWGIPRPLPTGYISMSGSPIGYESHAMYAGGSISGTVTDSATNTPRAGACVYADFADDGTYVGVGAVTDANGHYTLPNLAPNANIELSASKGYKVGFYASCTAGQPPTTHWNGGASSEATAANIDVTPGQDTGGVDAGF